MSIKWLLSFVVLALAIVPAVAHADDIRLPAFKQILSAAGDGIPPEWAGVWTREDSIYDCDGNFLRTETVEDTLCPGDPAGPSSEEFQIECTGDVTANTMNLTCTANITIKTCTVEYRFEILGELSGDTYTYNERFEINYSGEFPCDFIPDMCEVRRGVSSRVSPAPKSCFTATEKSSWGKVKTLYR